MNKTVARMIYIHVLSPLHSGTGQSVDVIDLPIAREKATGWPVIPGSSFKGVLRDGRVDDESNQLFGAPSAAGSLCFADQRILCLPVRSYYGTFAYVTCPLALSRHVRDCRAAGAAWSAPASPDVQDSAIITCNGSALRRESKVLLEDLDLKCETNTAADTIAGALADAIMPAEKKLFTDRFAIVSDNVFSFLSETATEITARVSINEETKIVKKGGLWYEEAVPAEAIFSGPLLITKDSEKAEGFVDSIKEATIQIGGKASVGRGLCRLVVGS